LSKGYTPQLYNFLYTAVGLYDIDIHIDYPTIYENPNMQDFFQKVIDKMKNMCKNISKCEYV